MENVKYLEDFRHNDYMGIFLLLLSDRNHPKIEVTYNNYAIHAFYSTSYDLNDLENEKNFINNGRRVLPTISLWYLTIESFINSLCKITSLVLGSDTEAILNKDIGSRLSFLIKSMNYDELMIKKTGIYNKINEFRQFRNELFHDRNTGKNIAFKKTNFSSIPFLCNQVDIFQSLLIVLELVTLLRYSIPGVDLMPNISIGDARVFHFDKLDTLYKNYLSPYFQSCLNKHKLQSKLELDIDKFSSLSESNLFKQGEIAVISRVEQDNKFLHTINPTTTAMGDELYREVIKDYNLPDGYTGNLNFIRNWSEFYKSKFSMRR